MWFGSDLPLVLGAGAMSALLGWYFFGVLGAVLGAVLGIATFVLGVIFLYTKFHSRPSV
jgi:hypothetical protein